MPKKNYSVVIVIWQNDKKKLNLFQNSILTVLYVWWIHFYSLNTNFCGFGWLNLTMKFSVQQKTQVTRETTRKYQNQEFKGQWISQFLFINENWSNKNKWHHNKHQVEWPLTLNGIIITVKPINKGHSRKPESLTFVSSCPLYTG